MKKNELDKDLPNKSYQLLFSKQDPIFKTTPLSQHHLCIYISDTSFKISCFNPTTTQCILLESYSLAHGKGRQRVQAIEHLYQNHQLLTTGNWSAVTLCVGNQQYTLVPTSLFREKRRAVYLNFACPTVYPAIQHFTHSSLDLSLVFAIDPLLINWVQHTYKNTQLYTIHQASSLIEGTLHYLLENKSGLSSNVLVFVEENSLHIIILERDKLLYYNRFRYATSEEFLNYILAVLHTLKLDPSSQEVFLGGAISSNSTAHQKVRKYIRKLFFIEKSLFLSRKSILDRKTWAAHWDVLNISLCHRT